MRPLPSNAICAGSSMSGSVRTGSSLKPGCIQILFASSAGESTGTVPFFEKSASHIGAPRPCGPRRASRRRRLSLLRDDGEGECEHAAREHEYASSSSRDHGSSPISVTPNQSRATPNQSRYDAQNPNVYGPETDCARL